MGCWAIGGPNRRGNNSVGWGPVNDDESIRALSRAVELGVTFYDAADVYGSGHSETLIAQALGDQRDRIVIATKAGCTYVEATREAPGDNGDPASFVRCARHVLRR